MRCLVENVTYQNEENGYSILKCRVPKRRDKVAVLGYMPGIREGATIEVSGEWKMHKKYGEQFNVTSYKEEMPASTAGMRAYLISNIKGVGDKFARDIIKKFGTNTFKIIDESPEKLLSISGIGEKKLKKIEKSWKETKEIRELSMFLQSYGISASFAKKAYAAYGDKAISKIRQNPYRLADDIRGIGFKTADEKIAEKMGISKTASIRIESGILYTLQRMAGDDGHCFGTKEQIIEKGIKLLEVSDELIEEKISAMVEKEKIMKEDEAIYLLVYHRVEKNVAKNIGRLLKNKKSGKKKYTLPEGITYHENQLKAIDMAVSSNFMVLTGGPGTGKTTVIKGILQAYKGKNILLAAPTGRAAKRMSESTGREAKTIHRLLEFKEGKFAHNEEEPLEGDLIVVDECSMIDLLLMNSLLKAIPNGMSVVLVGDIDQLPSVGAGNVLRDIIDSGKVPVTRLTQIFRQAGKSNIIVNAHRINRGMMPTANQGRDSDFFYIPVKDGTDQETRDFANETILKKTVECVTKHLPARYGVDPIRDIQVLLPMRKGVLGTANLNLILQKALNGGHDLKEGVAYGAIIYYPGDKVMQMRNNYDKSVFNGDVGYIVGKKIDEDEEEKVVIKFEDREVEYDTDELCDIGLAYACTIHKSQGSEYPIVVMPMTISHFMMLQRNLLYTGVTRAKDILLLIGMPNAIKRCVKNVVITKRNSRLKERIIEQF